MSAAPPALELDVAPDALVEVFVTRDRVGLDVGAGLASVCADLCPQTARDLGLGVLRSALGAQDPEAPAPEGAIVRTPAGHQLRAAPMGRAAVLTAWGAGGARARVRLQPARAVRLGLALLPHADHARQRAAALGG